MADTSAGTLPLGITGQTASLHPAKPQLSSDERESARGRLSPDPLSNALAKPGEFMLTQVSHKTEIIDYRYIQTTTYKTYVTSDGQQKMVEEVDVKPLEVCALADDLHHAGKGSIAERKARSPQEPEDISPILGPSKVKGK